MIDVKTALRNYANNNAWGKPHVDKHFLINPNKLTSDYGVRGSFSLPGFSYPVPTTTKTYVVYGFGGINPAFLGMFGQNHMWRSLEEISVSEDIVINAFINHRSLVLSGVHVLLIDNSYLVFAVEKELNKAMLGNDMELYIRFYSNSFFTSDEGLNHVGVLMKSTKVNDLQDAATLLSDYNLRNYVDIGNTYWFRNGYLTNKPAVSRIDLGDTLQYVWDSSGQGYFDLPYDDLTVFTSTLDSRPKYLILMPEYFGNKFTFFDDLDIYICGYDSDNQMKGMFYDRVVESDLRQVGYCDWSIDVSRVNAFISEQSGEILSTRVFIRVYVRQTSDIDMQVGDGQFLRDLYSIDYSTRDNILAGTVATLPFWKAAALEESSFMNWVGRKSSELTIENVKGVFNHYGTMQALQIPVATSGQWIMPELAKEASLVINFDTNGDLHSIVKYGYNTIHSKENGITNIMVLCGEEVTSGIALDTVSLPIDGPCGNYDQERFYFDTSENKWTLAALGTDYTYDSLTDTVTWSEEHIDGELRKRQSNIYATRSLVCSFEELGEAIDIFEDGSIAETGFGFTSVYVWINKKRGVEGLDYTVDGFKVYVTNRHYVKYDLDKYGEVVPVSIVIVAAGLTSDARENDFGFIANNMVNHNMSVELVRNRNLTLFINGQYRELESVYLAEDYHGDDVVTFTNTAIREWAENKNYSAGEVISFNSSIYVVPDGGAIASVSFDPDLFTRLWLNSPYWNESDDSYVYLFVINDVLKYKEVLDDGSITRKFDFSDLELGTAYHLKIGLPIENAYTDGSVYSFNKVPNVVSRLMMLDYTDGLTGANSTSDTIINFFEMISEQSEIKTLVINKQYRVISTMMVAITDALAKRIIMPTKSNLSSAAIDIMLKDYTYLLESDPVYGNRDIYDYVICFGHGQSSPVGLPAIYVSFLSAVNDIYFDGRINISRDYYIT